jgi:DNA-binding response OmpR family regulator
MRRSRAARWIGGSYFFFGQEAFRVALRRQSKEFNAMPIKVLSVDDSRAIRLIVTRALMPFDCTVIEAANGEDGLAAVVCEKPDLILLDITMPVMDGVTMLAKLKENDEWKDIPVIMLTAESGRDNVLHICQLGVRDYLVKPFRVDHLIEKVTRAVRLAKRPPPGPGLTISTESCPA